MEYARELLDELHPIEDTPVCIAFPWLGCFTMCGVGEYPKRRSNQDGEERHSIDAETNEPLLSKKNTVIINGKEVAKKQKKKKKNNMKNQQKLEEEPLAQLGFGIIAYVNILWTLIVVFLVFSLMLYPSMRFFHQGIGYDHVNPELAAYEAGTIGNMGYSSVQCAVMPLDVEKMSLQCPYGKIGEIYDYGINLSDENASNCANNDDILACKPDSKSFEASMFLAPGKVTHNFEFGDFQHLYDTATIGSVSKCNASGSRLFVQYTCI